MRRVAVLAFLVLASFSSAYAQSTNASLTGRLTDPAKALVDDAIVAATSDATSVRYETDTNRSGEYHLTNLPPGSYLL